MRNADIGGLGTTGFWFPDGHVSSTSSVSDTPLLLESSDLALSADVRGHSRFRDFIVHVTANTRTTADVVGLRTVSWTPDGHSRSWLISGTIPAGSTGIFTSRGVNNFMLGGDAGSGAALGVMFEANLNVAGVGAMTIKSMEVTMEPRWKERST